MLRTIIVENFLPFRKMFKDTLSKEVPSINIVEAGNGQEALKQLALSPPDLIFMDVGLPGENGIALTGKIKSFCPDTTIVILSSYDLPEYREAATQSGASCYIVKSSMKVGEISRMVKCFDKAKTEGRQKPICVRLAAESASQY